MPSFEAERCLRCQDPVCVEGCPVNIPIPDFIHAIASGDMPGAAKILRGANPLPVDLRAGLPAGVAVRGRMPHGQALQPGGDRPPRALRGRLGAHAADQRRTSKITRKEKIAVIGAGPSGLVCAGELARLGYAVTIYEALHAPGGVLRYGIPEFRLPKAILDWEIDVLKAMGVEIVCNVVIGRTLTLRRPVRAAWAMRPCSSAPARGCRSSWASPART